MFAPPPVENSFEVAVAAGERALMARYGDRLQVEPALTRALVSFQANKTRPAYRWYKYKEAFSADLIDYLLDRYVPDSGRLLDPFAGSGTALFAASGRGWQAEGIEVLPVGQAIVRARQILQHDFTAQHWQRLAAWADAPLPGAEGDRQPLPDLPIARGAYPAATQQAIEQYLAASDREPPAVREILRFALLCVLESVSYTRKDGQYLRWDRRAPRARAQFHKGKILALAPALQAKLREILTDRSAMESATGSPVRLYPGSCLDILPQLATGTYDAIATSPPYCNRYDYTRTYALELALLGIDAVGLKALRQAMLSCTVENRVKDLDGGTRDWQRAIAAADQQPLLQAILDYLENCRRAGTLNNAGIPRMVRGYFYELAVTVAECARVLRPGGWLWLVNDNVRYAGVSIPVDLILAALAEQLGLAVEAILVLPSNKGNSSQQMGACGRAPLRKCVYVWHKPHAAV